MSKNGMHVSTQFLVCFFLLLGVRKQYEPNYFTQQ